MQGQDFEYAGFWVRVAATLIDTLLIMLITLPLLWSIYGADYFESTAILNGPADFIISWLMPAVGVIVFWMVKQATPGKNGVVIARAGCRHGKQLVSWAKRGALPCLLCVHVAAVYRHYLGGV